MKIYDCIITLNKNLIVQNIVWENHSIKQLYGEIWDKYLNESITGLFHDINITEQSGEIIWENNSFDFSIYELKNNEMLLFIKLSSDREYLFSKTLDKIGEGIQIYDRNACAVFFNKNSRVISDIPVDVDVTGKHLLDMYDLDDDISTAITSLKTGEPVINRVDHYNSTDGTFIATANTAYPIKKNGHILGTVVFEQTKEIVNQYMNRMGNIDHALKAYNTADENLVHFTGYTFENIIGSGKKIEEAIALAKKISIQDCSVLLVGETGTGKELFAQSIHKSSSRRNKKFLAINCAAIPSTLIESLLFGTSKGSFTGSEDKPGYFEEANGGTLFLDELNSMSLNMQSKILRVLQEKTFRRVGGKKDIHTDIRIISSCNENPFEAIEDNRLRKDLFYRISTVMIDLPPLREHIEDLDILIQNHIRNNNVHFVNKIESINPVVIDYLKKYSWPGNVRELYHVIDYALNVADSNTIEMIHLPKYLYEQFSIHPVESKGIDINKTDFKENDLQDLMDAYEAQVIKKALNHYGENITQTANALGIKRQSLQYRIKKYGIVI